MYIVRQSLHPLILKFLAEKPSFSVSLRVCRVISILIRSFLDQLHSEVESYLVALLRMGVGENESEESGKKETVFLWLRVLALEILRG